MAQNPPVQGEKHTPRHALYWHGDVVFRDVVLPNKRFEIGAPKRDIPTDISKWLSNAPESLVLKDALARLPIGATGSLGPLWSRGAATTAYTRR
jgi:hypothetical protein